MRHLVNLYKCKTCTGIFRRINKRDYCSFQCKSVATKKKYRKHYYKRKLENGGRPIYKFSLQSCIFCSKDYSPTRKNQQYCSTECASKASKKYLDIPSCLSDASRKLDKNIGYVRVYAPMHRRANTRGYVYEHMVVAEDQMGRLLTKDEVVHHKNGKRWDNRPENLEVMNKTEHAKLRGQREEDLNI
jgi:hypothetical protein